jgi:hypothetical protein
MNKNKKIALFIIILIGIFVPFIDSILIFEMFFLLIPFAIIFVLTLIYLIVSLINKKLNPRKALFVFSILPIFVISQLTSDFVFDRIQRFRIKRAIVELEKSKNNNGEFPKNIDLKMGVEYTAGENGYAFKYSRGFLETVRYNSTDKEFVVYGWND